MSAASLCTPIVNCHKFAIDCHAVCGITLLCLYLLHVSNFYWHIKSKADNRYGCTIFVINFGILALLTYYNFGECYHFYTEILEYHHLFYFFLDIV